MQIDLRIADSSVANFLMTSDMLILSSFLEIISRIISKWGMKDPVIDEKLLLNIFQGN